MKKIIICLAAIASLVSCSSDQKAELGTTTVYEYYDVAQTKLKSIGNYKVDAEKQLKHSSAGLQLLETYNRVEIWSELMNSGLDSVAHRLNLTTSIGYRDDNTPVIFAFNKEKMLKFQQYLSENPDVLRIFPSDMKFMWSAKGDEDAQFGEKELIYYLYATRNSGLTINYADIAEASVGKGYDDLITVMVSMTAEGAERWAQMTDDNKGRCIAITVDGKAYSVPMVRSAITGGKTEISGNFTEQEATDLMTVINAYVLNGEWRSYHQNGKLKEVRQYEKGERVGEWSTYDENGKLIKTRGVNKD